MNDSNYYGDERSGGPSRPPLGEELLPPVEEPSARFIIQLFVVPAIIVLAIVGLWLTATWIFRRTSADPIDLIQGLEQGPSVARWQRASDLAFMLPNKRYAEIRRNSKASADLARILNREVDSGGMEEHDVRYRYYLIKALGEFEVQDGTDVLLKAAVTNRGQAEQLTRYGALEAIAARAFHLRGHVPPNMLAHPELHPTLVRLASDEDPLVRRRTAFALGQIGTAESIEQLELMVDDPNAETRYNAAVALANHGNAKALETLAEMLDLDELAGMREETDDQDRAFKRQVLITSATAAAETLKKQNPKADQSPVISALEKIVAADSATLDKARLPSIVVSHAERTLKTLKASQ